MVAVQSNRSRIVLVSGSNRRPNCNHRINGILQTIMPAIKTHHSITVAYSRQVCAFTDLEFGLFIFFKFVFLGISKMRLNCSRPACINGATCALCAVIAM